MSKELNLLLTQFLVDESSLSEFCPTPGLNNMNPPLLLDNEVLGQKWGTPKGRVRSAKSDKMGVLKISSPAFKA